MSVFVSYSDFKFNRVRNGSYLVSYTNSKTSVSNSALLDVSTLINTLDSFCNPSLHSLLELRRIIYTVSGYL